MSVNFFMYYSTFLEQRRCPSQHSGTKMKSAAEAGESCKKKKKVSIASSIASDSTHLIRSNFSSASFTWAVWHELRLSGDTEPYCSPSS